MIKTYWWQNTYRRNKQNCVARDKQETWKGLEGLPATYIWDVGCVHLGFAPYLARIRCPLKSPLRASVKIAFLFAQSGAEKKILACIRFRNDPCMHSVFRFTWNQHLRPSIRNFNFYYQVLTTVIGSIIQPLSMRRYTIDRNHFSCNLNPHGVGVQGHPLL